MKRDCMKLVLGPALLVCMAVMIFTSMIAVATAAFFINLKVLLIFSIVWLVFFHAKLKDVGNVKLASYLIFFIPCVYGLVTGFMNGNQGAGREVALYLYAPIVYVIIFAALATQVGGLLIIEKVVKVSSVIIVVIFFYLYFSADGVMRDYLARSVNFLLQHPVGYIKAHSVQTTSLLFLTPVMAAYYYYRLSIFNGALLTAMVAMLFLSGRRSAIILFLILILFMAVWAYFKSYGLLRVLKIFAPLLIGWPLYLMMVQYNPSPYDNAAFLASIGDAFPIIGNSARFVVAEGVNSCSFETLFHSGLDREKIGAALRMNQLLSLLEEIKRSPLFGLGFGHVIESCIRSEDQPWRFELAYVALIMNVGIVGLLIFILSYLFPLYSAVQNREMRAHSYPLIVGSVFFLICSSTNPYLFSVENIWIYFMPYFIALLSCLNNRAADYSV